MHMTDPGQEAADVARIIDALANGLRSELEIAKTTRLPLERVRISIAFLVAHGCIIEGAPLRFRLTDNGNDMLKETKAAQRTRRA